MLQRGSEGLCMCDPLPSALSSTTSSVKLMPLTHTSGTSSQNWLEHRLHLGAVDAVIKVNLRFKYTESRMAVTRGGGAGSRELFCNG